MILSHLFSLPYDSCEKLSLCAPDSEFAIEGERLPSMYCYVDVQTFKTFNLTFKNSYSRIREEKKVSKEWQEDNSKCDML